MHTLICSTLYLKRSQRSHVRHIPLFSRIISLTMDQSQDCKVAPLKLLIHSQTPTCNRWSVGMDKPFHLTLYNGYNYLCMLGLKLIFVSKIATGVFLVKCRAYTLYAREQYFHTLIHFNYFTSANNLKTNDMKDNKEQQFRETDSFSKFHWIPDFYHFIISINAN